MVEHNEIVDDILGLLKAEIHNRYRVAVMIVGPPGSGKSSIAELLRDKINLRFQDYLAKRKQPLRISSNLRSVTIEEQIPVASNELVEKVRKGFFSHVEDINFQSHMFKDGDGSTIIFGRGGLPNSIRVSSEALNQDEPVKIAQVVPMDGFHLSQAHLDHFQDPGEAHMQRGSPRTFDSNNYLQLCHLLSESCKWKPPATPTTASDDLMECICETFEEAPLIYYPGFDHALKDPVRDQYVADTFTRILIMEGLYLTFDQENWANVYPTMSSAGRVLVYRIDIEEGVAEARIACRHLSAGIVDSYEQGIQRFKNNDRLNMKLIQKYSLDLSDVVTIRND